MTKGPHEVEFPEYMFGRDRYGHYGTETITVEPQGDLFTEHSWLETNSGKLGNIEYRYGEDKFLKECTDYVAGTYQGHYVGGGQYQTVDIWNTLGSAATTCRDTAIKYLMRYGKKGGHNKNDLLKAVHYITLLNHYTEELDNDETSGK